jgi:hypothetical protein
MGTSLNGLTPAGTYPGLIKTGDNAPIDGTLKTLSDGNGNNLPMAVSTTAVNFTNQLQQSGVAVPTASQVAAKQDTLVSGTNIKTINGTSVLGSGNIVTPSTNPSGVAGAIQFSNGSAFASDATNFFWDDTNNRLGVGTNTPTVKYEQQGGGSLFNMGGGGTNSFRVQRNGFTLLNIGTDNASIYMTADGGNNGNIQFVKPNGSLLMQISDTGTVATIKGSGSTSATTSLLVQNSAGTQLFRVDDNNRTYVGANIILLGSALSLSADVNNPQIYNTGGASLGINAPGSNGIIYGRSNSNTQEFFGFSALGSAIGSSTLTASAVLAVNSTTQGFLPPRMTTTQKNAIASPAAGLVVYDSTTNKLCCYNGSTWNDLF